MDSATHIIKTGYTEETRNLDFRAKCGGIQDAMDCALIIKDYNEFDGELVATAIADIFGELYKNTFMPSIEFGREGSPVMYISVKGLDLDILERFAQITHADEAHMVGDRTGRVWWD